MRTTVVFRCEDIVPADFTHIGTGIRGRKPRRWDLYRQLERGPFLAAFDAGLYDMRDIAPRDADRVRIAHKLLPEAQW